MENYERKIHVRDKVKVSEECIKERLPAEEALLRDIIRNSYDSQYPIVLEIKDDKATISNTDTNIGPAIVPLDYLQRRKPNLNTWKTPKYYFGDDPVGEYLIYSRNRDSKIYENSNYERILEDLKKLDEKEEYVYDWRANHWACGWVEYIMIKPDAPDSIIEKAESIIKSVFDYPFYDEDDYTERQHNTIIEYWQEIASEDQKIKLCDEAGVSRSFAYKPFRDVPISLNDIVWDKVFEDE